MAAPPPIGHIPNITEACASFEHRLDEFRKEAQGGAQFFYAMMAIHGMAGGSDEVYRTIDDAALFWSTNVAALQTAFFVTLGRVFDQCSDYTIDRLLKLAQANPAVFSKEALAERKRRLAHNADEWLPEYLKTAYEPDTKDFRCLRRYVDKHRKIYLKNYDPIRDRVYAHKELALKSDKDAVFANAHILQLEKLFTFLNHIYEILWQLCYNGVKPRFRRIVSSSSHMLQKPVPSCQSQTVRICSTRVGSGLSAQGLLNGLVGAYALACGGADDGAHACEQVGPPIGAEPAGDFAVGGRGP